MNQTLVWSKCTLEISPPSYANTSPIGCAARGNAAFNNAYDRNRIARSGWNSGARAAHHNARVAQWVDNPASIVQPQHRGYRAGNATSVGHQHPNIIEAGTSINTRDVVAKTSTADRLAGHNQRQQGRNAAGLLNDCGCDLPLGRVAADLSGVHCSADVDHIPNRQTSQTPGNPNPK